MHKGCGTQFPGTVGSEKSVKVERSLHGSAAGCWQQEVQDSSVGFFCEGEGS